MVARGFRRFTAILVLSALVTGCQSLGRSAAPPAAPTDVAELAALLTGSFSSATQHAADPENYRNIALHTAPIWTGRSDGPWLYVEQALAGRPERPYRQRVYQLAASTGGTVESRVFMLPGDPLEWAGAWREPQRLDALSPDALESRTGCTVVLRRRADGVFTGGTVGTGCASELAGASYATSDVEITARRLVTWDRGFASDGQQVWGATTGGYIFERLSP